MKSLNLWLGVMLVVGVLGSKYIWKVWFSLYDYFHYFNESCIFLGVIFVGSMAVSYLNWWHGSIFKCERCGGLLGKLHNGRCMYGRHLPMYRRCYACGFSTAEVNKNIAV